VSGHFLDNERLAELFVNQATEGLSPAEQRELKDLLQAHPDADAESIEQTAAALFLAGDWQEEPMPQEIRSRLDAVAANYSSETRFAAISKLPLNTTDRVKPGGQKNGLAWFAAAAAIAIAVVAWWPRLQTLQDRQVDLLTQASLDLGTLSAIRERFVAESSPLLRPWTKTEDVAGQGVTGDIVWDTASQTGYMRFAGLPVNDPQEVQYQLWIFDATRDERYPVDGGVFNIPAGAREVVVPILAKLQVRDPSLFAITMEKPGGAVVSARERIVVVASVKAG
jgi:hypothetical protein